MVESKKITSLVTILIGLFFVALGSFPLLAAFDIGPFNHNDISGMPGLGFVFAGMFIAAGLSVIVGQSAPLVNGVLAILILAGLAAIGNWIAFGPGERVCSEGVSLFGSQFSDMSCRIPFGLGAIIVDGVVCVVSVSLLQKALGGPPRLAKLLRTSEIVLLLTLAPLFLLPVIIMFAQGGIGALRTRVATGAWPRNEEFIARQKASLLNLFAQITQKKPHP